jgi:hypothetical protein
MIIKRQVSAQNNTLLIFALVEKRSFLEAQVWGCETQIERAKKLISGLSEERDRWEKAAQELSEGDETDVGNTLLRLVRSECPH